MDLKESPKKLFGGFQPVSTAQWEEKIAEDLQGADYDKNLVWKTAEGISVKPYYRAEHISHLAYLGSLPDQYPFVRGTKIIDNAWLICQNVDVPNIEEANRMALDALKNGANTLSLNVSEVRSEQDLDRLLQGISPVETNIHYHSSHNYKVLMIRLVEVCKKRSLDPGQLIGSFDFDPNSFVLLRGDFYQSEAADMDDAADLVEYCSEIAPKLRLISINGHHFHNSGANIVQELAFSLASASDYVARISEKDVPLNVIMPRLAFFMSSGSSYFMEIAKFRAARMLWAYIAAQYHTARKPESMKAYIHAITSNWNKTVYDPYVNLLRSTTEAMAAAVAGADVITVNPFDLPFKESDDFSTRIARNQQILLKEEAYLDKVIDPAAGSYYIEHLTESVAGQAWELFVKVEQLGGMIEAVKAGFVQDEIEKNARQRLLDIANRRLTVLGTNQYPNPQEKMLDKIQEETLEETEVPETETKYKTLRTGRAADTFEDLRLATEIYIEAGNKTPTVFLFSIGNLAMRKARATFSSGFFGCAGYTVIDNPVFKTVEEGAKVVAQSQPSIVVICSSDEEYGQIVPEICKQLNALNNDALLVVAGYPKDHIDSFKEAGINEFIHIRSNVLETLTSFHKKLGIINEEL